MKIFKNNNYTYFIKENVFHIFSLGTSPVYDIIKIEFIMFHEHNRDVKWNPKCMHKTEVK